MNKSAIVGLILGLISLTGCDNRVERTTTQVDLTITKKFNQICHKLGGRSTEPASTTCDNLPLDTETAFIQAYNKQIGRTKLYISHSLNETYDIYEQ